MWPGVNCFSSYVNLDFYVVTLSLEESSTCFPFPFYRLCPEKDCIHVTLSVAKGLGVVGTICALLAPPTDSSSSFICEGFLRMTFEARPLLSDVSLRASEVSVAISLACPIVPRSAVIVSNRLLRRPSAEGLLAMTSTPQEREVVFKRGFAPLALPLCQQGIDKIITLYYNFTSKRGSWKSVGHLIKVAVLPKKDGILPPGAIFIYYISVHFH